MKTKNLYIVLIMTLAAMLVWLAFFWQPTALPIMQQDRSHARLQVAETPTGGDFTLQSPSGPVSLSNYRGKVVLLYFGYTFCPDVCPTSLAILAQALSALNADESEKVQGFLISVDPERDTMDVLNAYAPFFHPSILGLSGTHAQIAHVARQYGARYSKQKPDSDGLYSVDHSSFTYVVAPDGKLAASLPHNSSSQQIVAMIRSLLSP